MKMTVNSDNAAIDINICEAPSRLLGSSPSHVCHLHRGHAATGDGLKLGPHRPHKEAKVQGQHHEQPDQHHEAIKDVEVDLMVCDRPMPALAKLNEPKDVTDEQQRNSDVQAGIDRFKSRGLDTVEAGGGDVDESGQKEQDDADKSCQADNEQNTANGLAVVSAVAWTVIP